MYSQQSNGDFLIGYIPHRDGSDYDANADGPAYAELVDLLARERFDMDEHFIILVAGRMGSPGTEDPRGEDAITAPMFVTTRRSVLNAIREELDDTMGRGAWTARDIVGFTTDPANTPTLIERLFMLQQTPIHITGMVVRRVGQE